jgi:peptidyl-tRNA hydrolase
MSDSVNRPLHIPGKRFVVTKRMIENAQANTKSNRQAAKWLSISYNTYKKWAQYYGVFEQHLNQSGTGIKKGWATYKVKMEDIFSGKENPNYSLSTLKKRLIDEGYVQEECSLCGWNEKRLTDNKVCLSLDFVDGDSNNKKYENMRLLCPNCYYNNVGNFHNSKYFCK